VTPFRVNGGRWLTDAAPLVALVGNGSALPGDAPWVCALTVTSCCEEWRGGLALHLTAAPPLPPVPPLRRAPFAAVPLLFPNAGTHFGPGYNANRSVLVPVPAGTFGVALWVLVTGHGSDPPPPVAAGCEYAPTTHAFTFTNGAGPTDAPPLLVANTTAVDGGALTRAGSPRGCADAARSRAGVLPNSHGDWVDGRNGWCPGAAVTPLVWDITPALRRATVDVLNVTYSALSYWVDGTHASPEGCGGDIFMTAVLLFE
jgi:hypothetical protein